MSGRRWGKEEEEEGDVLLYLCCLGHFSRFVGVKNSLVFYETSCFFSLMFTKPRLDHLYKTNRKRVKQKKICEKQ